MKIVPMTDDEVAKVELRTINYKIIRFRVVDSESSTVPTVRS